MKAALAMPDALLHGKVSPEIVAVPSRTVLALEGQGAPGSLPYMACIEAIYGIAFSLKLTRKAEGREDFRVGALETIWWFDDPQRGAENVPLDEWRWKLHIDVPRDVTKRELAAVIQSATTKKRGKLEGSAWAKQITLEKVPKRQFGRILHVGPYSASVPAYQRLLAELDARGFGHGDAFCEVYLNDPRRVPAEELKTICMVEALKGAEQPS